MDYLGTFEISTRELWSRKKLSLVSLIDSEYECDLEDLKSVKKGNRFEDSNGNVWAVVDVLDRKFVLRRKGVKRKNSLRLHPAGKYLRLIADG